MPILHVTLIALLALLVPQAHADCRSYDCVIWESGIKDRASYNNYLRQYNNLNRFNKYNQSKQTQFTVKITGDFKAIEIDTFTPSNPDTDLTPVYINGFEFVRYNGRLIPLIP